MSKAFTAQQVYYSNYETGKRDIPTDVLEALALYYDTSTDYLLGLTDEIRPYPRSHIKQGDNNG